MATKEDKGVGQDQVRGEEGQVGIMQRKEEEVWHQEVEQGREQKIEGEDGRKNPDIPGKSKLLEEI